MIVKCKLKFFFGMFKVLEGRVDGELERMDKYWLVVFKLIFFSWNPMVVGLEIRIKAEKTAKHSADMFFGETVKRIFYISLGENNTRVTLRNLI